MKDQGIDPLEVSGDLNYDGVEYRLQVTEKRKNERNIILLDAAGAVLEYIEAAGIADLQQAMDASRA